jgi:hypothetical protein
LTWKKKGFHKFTFSANGESSEAFKPFAHRNTRSASKPVRKLTKIVHIDLPLASANNQVTKKGFRNPLRRILGMRDFAVKTPYHLVFQPLGFSRVLCSNHSFSEGSELFARELARCELKLGKIAHFLSFLSGKASDLFDNLSGAHGSNL